jgi:hypothetical protein
MKKFFGMLFAAIVAFVGMASTKAYDDTITFTNRKLSGVTQIYNVGTTYKEVQTSAGKKIAYCFNKSDDAPPTGSTLKATDNSILPNEEKTNQYIYILDNGYGGSWNTNIFGNTSYTNDQKYYITQVALWMAQGSVDANYVKNSGTLGAASYSLYEAALKNSAVTPYEPKIELKGSTSMTLKDGKYVSDSITVSVTGANEATITLLNAPAASNFIINGTSAGNVATVKNGDKVQAVVPSSKVANNMEVIISGKTTATRKKIQIYKYQGSDAYQNIGLIFVDNYTAKAEIKLSIAPTGQLEVLKVDENGNNIKDAILVLKDQNGNVVAKWNTTDENPKTFTNLPIGAKYTLYEEKAPAGYKKIDEQVITITSAKPIVIKAVDTKTTPIKISKRDITNENELPGATLVVKDSFGNVIDEWVSESTPHYITKELTPGEYTLSETIAPKGYVLSTSTVTFTVKSDGTVDGTVVMYNAPMKGVKISKQDATTGKELPGATLVLKDADGNVIDEWVSTTKPHYIENLPEGTYTLIEKIAPAGYGLSEEVITFEVKYDGSVMSPVVMKNSPIPDTADINIVYVIGGIVLSLVVGAYSFTKLNKKEQ